MLRNMIDEVQAIAAEGLERRSPTRREGGSNKQLAGTVPGTPELPTSPASTKAARFLAAFWWADIA